MPCKLFRNCRIGERLVSAELVIFRQQHSDASIGTPRFVRRLEAVEVARDLGPCTLHKVSHDVVFLVQVFHNIRGRLHRQCQAFDLPSILKRASVYHKILQVHQQHVGRRGLLS